MELKSNCSLIQERGDRLLMKGSLFFSINWGNPYHILFLGPFQDKMYVFIQPLLLWAGCDTRPISKQRKPGLNSEFSFS